MLSPYSAVYGDTHAYYAVDQGALTLTAHLTPLTGRLRFKGTKGQSVTFYGLEWYNQFTYKGALNQNVTRMILTAQSDGYTPYVYGCFADTIRRDLTIELNDDYVYSRCFGDNVLAK